MFLPPSSYSPLPSLFEPANSQPELYNDQHNSLLTSPAPGLDCLPHNLYPTSAITTNPSVYTSTISGQEGHKRHSTPATLVWLDQHYHLTEGICIPRNSVYFNYVDFCSKNKMTPVNAASFGKVSVDR